jgi:hypothetical protein
VFTIAQQSIANLLRGDHTGSASFQLRELKEYMDGTVCSESEFSGKDDGAVHNVRTAMAICTHAGAIGIAVYDTQTHKVK